MGFIENALHPDRKRQENWQTFSSDVGGIFISEGPSSGYEVHIPFKGHQIIVSTRTEGHAKRTVLSTKYSSGDFQFKIFGWGGLKIPVVDRDPYLNSECPELAPSVNVEFNNSKKMNRLLASQTLCKFVIEAPYHFTLEAGPDQLCLDNRAHGSKENGVITDVDHLHAVLNVFKCTLHRMEIIDSASAGDVRNALKAEIAVNSASTYKLNLR